MKKKKKEKGQPVAENAADIVGTNSSCEVLKTQQ